MMGTNKTVFLFSGQGSQAPGMGSTLMEQSSAAGKVFDCASAVLSYDLKEMCLNGTPEQLADTKVAQPAIMAVSLAALAVMTERGVMPSAVAGHSLGEYAAMVAAGMLTMEDGFRLISHRAAAMGKCAANQNGAMVAVMGLDAKEIEKVCTEVEGYVLPVNYNSTAQTVIAGEKTAVEAAVAVFKEMGKKAIPLAVSAAFHSAMMQPAADDFVEKAKEFAFVAPKVDFYSNLTGGLLTDFSDMPTYLARHIVSPVRFTDELSALWNAGCTHYAELGPGKVLTGLVKKTLKEATTENVS